MSKSRPHETLEGVAVVGVSGRFPGAKSVAEYWRNLVHGVEGISFFTTEELESAGIEPHRLHADNYVKAKGVLEDGDKFDAAFFGFSPGEAELMDPQHRIFLECAWEALESAGYDPDSYDGAIGLYAGASMNTYLLSNLYAHRDLIESFGFLQTSIHNRNDHLTTRVAYELNLKGPSVTVQTACSTSLVAVHLACQSLLGGECDMALAGGVALSVPLKKGYLYQEGGILSPDGHCRAFDARAQGTVDGNGVGVVLLKKLEDAVAEGDSVLAVIKGSAVNNDGSLKVGYTAPGARGQADVIAEAHGIAGVEMDTIGYIEAHGTGTTLGDPIEIEALTQAFRQGTTRKGFCAVGSVKTNIGHLDAAAGVSGLIKTVLALKHKQLPPSLHYERSNPGIDFENSPFYVNNRLMDWRAEAAPRRAGVSSFGIGGTNAHVVLEEAPPQESAVSSRTWHLLPLSARTSHALDITTTNLAAHLREHAEVNLADVAYTLQQGRRAFAQRRVVVCRNTNDAVRTLEVLDHKRAFTGLQEPQARAITMMFPGQGAQYANMGVELYDAEPLFREWIDRCAELLRPAIGFDLRDVMYPGAERAEEATEQLKQTFITQPALFVVEYALAQLWMSWGVHPESLIGHSIGEYVAACLAGVFSLEDALHLVAVRGRLMQDLPTGGMLVVPLPEKKVRTLLAAGTLSLAAINAPSLCVVAGATDRVDELERELTEQGLTCRRLHTSHAFHSEMMEPILDAFMTEVAKVTLNAPRIPYVSNVSGTWITNEEATDPAYWVRHIRQAVRFDDGATELFKDADRLLLEVGPGRTLSTLVRQHPYKGSARVVLSTLPHGDEKESAEAFMLATLGRLWLTGAGVDWSHLYENERRQRVPLPTYPFERQRYWIDPPREGRSDATVQKSLAKNPNSADWFYTPSWTRSTPPPPLAGQNDADYRQGWLVFADGQGLGAQMARRLAQGGHETVTVNRGDGFVKLGERAFVINPRRREDYERLFKEVREQGLTLTRIVHLWSVTPDDADPSSITSPEQLLEQGFFSLLLLAQVLGAEGGADPIRICVVTNEMQQVIGNELVCPEKATVLGPCLVIPQEYEHISCQSVDIVLPQPGSVQERRLIEHLTAESALKQGDAVVAYRNSYRWVQTFKQFQIESAAKVAPRLRKEGVYLLTGGLGGMALELAEYLAREARAKLILLGRSSLPAASEWDRWLATHDERDAVSRKIRKVRLLEALGAEVLIIGADVTSEKQVRAAVRQGRSRFGDINGVIHAAGVAGGGVIQLKTPVMAGDVLAPKVLGTRVLDTVFRGASLDFFILCSSRSAILGGFGQIDYCAANAYLDAFAHLRTSQGDAFTVAIDWDAWQAVGMLVDAASRHRRQEPPPPETYEKTGHPLLDKIISDTPDLKVYSTEVSPATHWVLDDHRIVGTAIMPGTGYLEMARAALERRPQAGAIEIRDAFFLAPLGLRDNEKREIRTVLERSGDSFEFRVLGRPASRHDAGDAEWQQYSIGNIRYVAPAASRQHDLEELLKRCREREIVITDEDEIDPDLGPRWQSLKRVHVGKNELLATLELSEEFAADMEQLKLHPALLDRATGTAKHYLVNEGHYLPMSYKRLKINGPLPRKINTYIRYRQDEAANRETITFDIIIMDEHGVECVEIEGFSQKRVNDTAEPIRGLSGSKGGNDEPDHPAIPALHEGDEQGIYQRQIAEGMTPQEGVEAFSRVLASTVPPQVIVSTKDLQASIEQAKALTQTRVAEELEKIESLRPVHARPAIATEYAVPGNDTERILTEIMQAMLGVERVGINDNFFELGGDSVLGIQIIARARRMGIQLTPQQLFQHPTVAELAAEAARSQPPEAVQEEVTGSVTLAPAQEVGGYTRSDFPLLDLDEDKFSKLAELIDGSDVDFDADETFEDEEADNVRRADMGEAVVDALKHDSDNNGSGVVSMSNRDGDERQSARAMDFSLFFFADDNAKASANKYQLYLQSAAFADRHGFAAVWTPERHFHANGGLYPSPSVLSAALATITENIHLRAGSVVLPLHHSIRVTEEWAVIDNLSNGRVGVSFTSGWIPNDFVFFPERFANKREEMFRGIREVQRLWRGSPITVRDGVGNEVELKILPRPIQTELPIWLTCSGDPEMFVKAGELGVNVLTALLTQSVEEMAEKIKLYREARARYGHDPEAGQVTLMMHTFVGDQIEEVLQKVRGPLCDYLRSHVGLVESMARSLDLQADIDREQYLDDLVSFAFERYYQTASLIGTPARCAEMIERLRKHGVDEVACFIDFGVDAGSVLESLHHLNSLKELTQRASAIRVYD